VLADGDIALDKIRAALLAGKDILKKGHKPPAARALEIVDKALKSGTIDTLRLADKKLGTVPLALTKVSTLRRLFLASNDLIELPDEIGALSALEELDLAYNSLTSLPAGIGRLSRLRTLNLHLNCVSELPDAFGELSALEDVNLGMNTSLKTEGTRGAKPLVEVPPPILRLARLRSLDLRHNAIRELPDGLAALRALEELVLFENALEGFPAVLEKLPALRRLSLGSQGEHKSLDGLSQVCRLGTLEQLDISFLDLDRLPDELGALARLQKLDISYNKVRTLPDGLYAIAGLRELKAKQVPLTDKTLRTLAERLPKCALVTR
jgi:Leucine-rich repeat (LRR) protein